VVLAALADERFLVLPHEQVATYEKRRADDRDRWLAGMQRAQLAIKDDLARLGRALAARPPSLANRTNLCNLDLEFSSELCRLTASG